MTPAFNQFRAEARELCLVLHRQSPFFRSLLSEKPAVLCANGQGSLGRRCWGCSEAEVCGGETRGSALAFINQTVLSAGDLGMGYSPSPALGSQQNHSFWDCDLRGLKLGHVGSFNSGAANLNSKH